MRLDGDAVTVCSRAPGVEWGGGLKMPSLGHFCGHVAAERSHPEDLIWDKGGRKEESWKIGPEREDEGDLRGEELARCEDQTSVSCGDVHLPFDTVMASSSRLIVGYALTVKKTKSFLQPKLEMHARNKGIIFVAIDRSRPLDEQGPFDVILHKISAETWQQQLKAYKQKHPEMVVLDPPESIKKVYNRQSMLQEVAALNLPECRGRVGVPKQLVVTSDPGSIAGMVAKAGLKFPLVAKPLWVDGTAKSHALSLAFNEFCLSELEPPLVLQEFVNHGGVLFKVYVVGDIVKVVRRFSLPDVCDGESGKTGVIPFPRVSCAAASADEADLDPSVGELPPPEMLSSLSRELRRRLGLNLFNLDMIREGGKGNHYFVIDINYFPGYGKMPSHEKVFTDFFLSLAEKKGK